MELQKVNVQQRTQNGKSPVRRLRAQGLIPAVAYGKGSKAQALSVSPKALIDILGTERGRNSVIELDVDGKDKLTVLLADYQYHPVTRALLHADFLQISLDEPVDVDVPFELTGRSVGVVMGGTLRQVFRKLPIRCLPGQIPVKITHDITELNIDEHVSVKDLTLPEGVTVRFAAERTVAAVVGDKRRGAADEEEGATAEGQKEKGK